MGSSAQCSVDAAQAVCRWQQSSVQAESRRSIARRGSVQQDRHRLLLLGAAASLHAWQCMRPAHMHAARLTMFNLSPSALQLPVRQQVPHRGAERAAGGGQQVRGVVHCLLDLHAPAVCRLLHPRPLPCACRPLPAPKPQPQPWPALTHPGSPRPIALLGTASSSWTATARCLARCAATTARSCTRWVATDFD